MQIPLNWVYLTRHVTQSNNVNYSILTVWKDSGGIHQSSNTIKTVCKQQGIRNQELESKSLTSPTQLVLRLHRIHGRVSFKKKIAPALLLTNYILIERLWTVEFGKKYLLIWSPLSWEESRFETEKKPEQQLFPILFSGGEIEQARLGWAKKWAKWGGGEREKESPAVNPKHFTELRSPTNGEQ